MRPLTLLALTFVFACKVLQTTTTTITTPTTTPTTTITKACVVEKADIGFLVDASGTVNLTEWKQSLEFASKIVSEYDIGPNKVRVGMIGFSSQAYSIFDFNNFTTKAEVVAAITNASKVSGKTATNLGLDMARNWLFQVSAGMRPGVPSILFVITDGQSDNSQLTFASAKAVQARKITVFAVGISGAVELELKRIASRPEYVYNFKDFSILSIIQEQFNKEICKVAADLPTVRPTTVPGPFAGCTVNSADLVFVVDTSSSVGVANFKRTKLFLSRMMDKLDFNKNRVGMITFNKKVTSEFELNQYNNATSVKARIDKLTYNDGRGTLISGALKHVREVSFTAANGDRSNVANIVILLTDGQAEDLFRTQHEGNLMKNDGIELFAVGIGSDINENELKSLASSQDFVYLSTTFNQLSLIENALGRKLCQGFTPPVVTTSTLCLCKDKEEGCADYGTHICFEQRYRIFAKDICPVFCDLCPTGCRPVYPPPKPCEDKILDCANRIDVCSDIKFRPYALNNCPKYCNLCADLNPPRIVQTTAPTTTAATTTPTTTVPSTRGSTKPPAPTTPYVPCDTNCYDKKRDCEDYDKLQCNEVRYEGFFRANCNAYCGFCTPKASCVTTPPPCEDKEDDCSAYGKDMCTDFPNFAKDKCARYCGICNYLGSTTTLPCVDRKNCSVYQQSDCREPDFRAFMFHNCRLFCNLCDVEY